MANQGEAPVDFMLRIMRDHRKPTELRIKCAGMAAPYLHPKLTATHVTSGDVDQRSYEDWLRLLPSLAGEEAAKNADKLDSDPDGTE